jgi:branched-chain amino acid transport system substrate-binding protein
MREAVYGASGVVLAERYFPVGELDFDTVIEQIIDSRPNFVFNTLIGVSAYAFFRAFRRAVEARGIDQPRVFPIASCSLSEPELIEIGPTACAGHVSSSVYFESIKTATNLAHTSASSPRPSPICTMQFNISLKCRRRAIALLSNAG